MYDVKDFKMLVTGTSRGLGLSVANGLVSLGASVVGVARSPRPAELHKDVKYFQSDLTVLEDIHKLYLFVEREFSYLNSLVNIAGVSFPPSLFESEVERFYETVQKNLISPFNLILKMLPLFSQDGRSSIVNFSSINAHLGFPGNPGYVASKSGVSGLTRALAIDLATKNIRVNSISPGYFPTSMTTVSFNDENLHSERARRTILNRWGNPEELVAPVAFLCSSGSSYITGHDLPVDGGWTAQGLR